MHRSRVITLVLAGCYAPNPQPGGPCSSAGDCPSDQQCGPDKICHGDMIEPVMDSGQPGVEASIDACTRCGGLIARYAFDGDLLDTTSAHPAEAVGAELTFVPGAIGSALHIPASRSSYARVLDDPAFDLVEGKLELRFRYGAGAGAGDLGLLSRDAVFATSNGHINLRIGHDRRVVLRIQRTSTNPLVQTFRCTSEPVSSATWHHVEVQFGPGGLAMRVDGTVASGLFWIDAGGNPHDCTDPWTTGIDGNDNPWVIGALTDSAMEGTGLPVGAIAGGVDIDDVAIFAVP